MNTVFSTLLVALGLTLCLAAASCSGGADNTSGSNGFSTGSTSAGSVSPTNQCSTGQCVASEVEAYGLCIEKACDQEYQSCFGPAYASGTYGGPCGTTYTCLGKCTCGDNACLQACPPASKDCQLCIGNTITACVANSGCKEPTCGAASVHVAAPKTCKDLANCCAAITDSTEKLLCNTEYSSGKTSGDIVCDAFVKGFEDLGYCP
jgi:hypothetical protein